MVQTEPLVRLTVLVLVLSVKALRVSVEPLALRVAVLPLTTSNSGKRPPVAVTTASFTLNVANEAVPGPPNPASKGSTAVSEPPFIVNVLRSGENAWGANTPNDVVVMSTPVSGTVPPPPSS